jgi:hypothetical protein
MFELLRLLSALHSNIVNLCKKRGEIRQIERSENVPVLSAKVTTSLVLFDQNLTIGTFVFPF